MSVLDVQCRSCCRTQQEVYRYCYREHHGTGQRMPPKHPLWMGHLRAVHPSHRLLYEKHMHLQLELGVLEDRRRSVCQRVRVPLQDQTRDYHGNHTDDHLRFEREGYVHSDEAGADTTPLALLRRHWASELLSLFLIPNLLMFRAFFYYFFSN